jgi:hypothetical protein
LTKQGQSVGPPHDVHPFLAMSSFAINTHSHARQSRVISTCIPYNQSLRIYYTMHAMFVP